MFSNRKVLAALAVSAVMLWATGSAESQQRRPCGPSFIPAPFRILVPQRAGGADLRPACRVHDQCYAGECGFSREECDCQFLHNMLCQCECARNPKKCQRKAWMYYNLVSKFGESSYHK